MIPVSIEDFDKIIDRGVQSDFMTNVVLKNRKVFETQIVQPYKVLATICDRYGVTMKTRCTLKEFHDTVDHYQYDIILLFGHNVAEKVEFWDGQFSFDRITDGVKSEFRGIIDLNICWTAGLYERIARKVTGLVYRRDDFVGFLPSFYFYAAVIELLANENSTYIGAIERIYNAFKNS